MKKKLSEWAKENGISYRTAYYWIKDGKFPCRYIKSSTGRFYVDMDDNITNGETVVYARVSNHSRKDELDYQVKRLCDFCMAKGMTVNKIYKEVASGMNDSRKELWKAINSKPSYLVVENKDRLTRFGFNYITELCKRQGTEIIVCNEAIDDREDLVKDLCSVIYSFCARLYGMRRAANKAHKIKNELIEE